MAERSGPPRAGLVAGSAGLLLPMAGLVLLLVRPELDVRWEHHPSHFWLVLISAVLAAALAWTTGEAAVRRGDPRVLHVSIAFLASAGFLALHALATPGVLLDGPNTGFQIATPVGTALGGVFAITSALDVREDRAAARVRRGRLLRAALLVLMAAWATWSLLELPPLDGLPQNDEALSDAAAAIAVALYLAAAAKYAQLWWHRPSPLLLAVPSAFILLAEAVVAMALATNWHLTWWEWHLLLLVAYALVATAARTSWHEERFSALYLPVTASGERQVSVLFADLQGFTSFSESHRPAEVTAMLNEYFAAGVPAVVTPHGGEVDRIVGDALMVTFNKRGDQPDHARRAAAAGLALQEATAAVAREHADWPRFRVGINTGPASVSLLGTTGGRTHTIIGDVVNTAARIEARAPVGGVAIGASTKALLPDARTAPLGFLELKGKSQPVEAFLLLAVDSGSAEAD